MRYFFVLLLLFNVIACTTQSSQQNSTQSLAEAARLNTQMGLLYLEQKQIALAENKLLLAKQQNPEDAYVWMGWAYFFQKTGRAEAAFAYYTHALHLAPQDTQIQNNYAAFLCQQRHYAKAIALFQQLLAQASTPNQDSINENAAICAYLNGQRQLAANYATQALAINPDRGLARQILSAVDSTNYYALRKGSPWMQKKNAA